MSFLDTFLGTNDDKVFPPPPGNSRDDYKRQIESQLSRLMKNKIPIEQLTNYRNKNNMIVSGLNEIVNIIDESKEHFGEFQKKINILKQKSNSGQTVREVESLLNKEKKVDELCVEQNRKIQEYESEKERLQRELSSKLEDAGKKDVEIRILTEQINSLQKTQSESVSTITSANEELIRYNKSLVDKIKQIADYQSEIINELDNDLEQGGSEVESKINSIKEKLIVLVDSIDDENNRMGGPPQVFRNGRQQPPPQNPPFEPIFKEAIANSKQRQNDVGVLTFTQESNGGPEPRGNGIIQGGKHKKTRRVSKKGGKGKKRMRMFKTRSKSKSKK